MQLSEPHRAGEATPSCARLDHGSCQRVTFILLGAASLFQPPDPQQDMVSLNRGVNRALVQLVWPCRGQMSGLAPPGALMAALGSRSCPEELRLSPARIPAPCRGRAPVPAGMLCVPQCAWKSWRWEQGRKEAQPDTKPFPRQQHVPSDVWMCSQSLYPSSPQHFHNLGTGEPGNLPAMTHLDHFNHFISGCSGSVVSSDLLAEAMGGSMDLG